MPISYLTGDATDPQGGGPKVILHCVNDLGAWGAGFVVPLGNRYPQAKASYMLWAKGQKEWGDMVEVSGPFQLGEVQFVWADDKLWVANLIGQHGINIGDDRRPPIRYEAIKQGLKHVWRFAASRNATVHMPKMGSGLARGSWPNVAKFVELELASRGVPVVVYEQA